ncbi:unnamed protein product [Chironomus riparius]|uniref:G-protein coupled receptors family 1 profile domain-containing protein n=1 Tax=Chironomus riparius TaxID=315576 RepID=A0A9N9RRW5_9DIPT|nr:unnamed protein product [Chironomus riparius]
MDNITTSLLFEALNFTTSEWPLDIVMNSSINQERDSMSLILEPLALISKHGKIHHHSTHPVTLSTEWSRLARLIFLTLLSVIGSVGNIFMISAVMVEDHLKKAGNSLVVNIGLTDLIVTIVVIPISIVSLLAMNKDEEETPLSVCKFQWFLAACAFLVSVLTLAVTSIENYMRLCTTQDGTQQWFSRSNVTAIILLIWFIGCVASGLQYVSEVSFDYCKRNKNSNKTLLPFETGVIATLILLPLLITFLVHIRIIIDAKKFMSQPSFKATAMYKSDFSLVRSNFYSFLTFVLFWLPFSIAFAISVTTSPKNINDKVFYYTSWMGLLKSCFHNIIYCITNRHFRNAYFNLFNYCCCKTTVSTARRRQQDVTRSDVRVHIIPGYNMYSYTSPQRATHGHSWAKRDCHEL